MLHLIQSSVLWRPRYLHDKEEDQDDEDADVWVQPRSRAAQAGRRGILGDFGPGEIIKKGVDTLSRHQLQEKKNELDRSKRRNIFGLFLPFFNTKHSLSVMRLFQDERINSLQQLLALIAAVIFFSVIIGDVSSSPLQP